MANQQSSKGPSLIGQTIGSTAPVIAGEDNTGLVKPLQIDASGNLLVAVTGAGSGGTSSVDGAAFVANTTAGTPAMGVYESAPSALTDGDLGVIALDANRNVKVNIVAGSSGNAAASATGAAVPASADYIGFINPAGNLEGVASENLDYDTDGPGSQPQTIIGIALPASGGPVAGGTSTNPLRVDPTGTTTQPVSAASLPLPSGAATEATLSTLNGKVTACDTGAVVVSSSALPTGASTAAKQPALGTAGAASADVITVQGIAAMTPILVDGSGATQPVSGTVTAAQATAANLNATVVGTGTFAVQATAVGTVADDATTPGAPVMVGGSAKPMDGTDPGSVSAENDVTRVITDMNRRLFVNTTHPRFGHKHLDGSSAYTDESIVADPGDGFQVVITNIIASTGAATALNFFLEEGASKIFGPIYLEAVAGRGFASGPINLPVTASTAVTLTSSAAIAQSFDIDYFIQAV